MRRVFVAALLLAASACAMALTEGRSATGYAFVCGGVGAEETARLAARRAEYSLWVVTAARRSGAYLADARVRIIDAKSGLVFDGLLDGPWLMIALPIGRYEVEATVGAERLRKTTTIHAGDRHDMVFYFDVAVDVLPKDDPSRAAGK